MEGSVAINHITIAKHISHEGGGNKFLFSLKRKTGLDSEINTQLIFLLPYYLLNMRGEGDPVIW